MSPCDAKLPLLLDDWVKHFDSANDLKVRACLNPFIRLFDDNTRDLISSLAWVLSKSKNRRRRRAIETLLEQLTRRTPKRAAEKLPMTMPGA